MRRCVSSAGDVVWLLARQLISTHRKHQLCDSKIRLVKIATLKHKILQDKKAKYKNKYNKPTKKTPLLSQPCFSTKIPLPYVSPRNPHVHRPLTSNPAHRKLHRQLQHRPRPRQPKAHQRRPKPPQHRARANPPKTPIRPARSQPHPDHPQQHARTYRAIPQPGLARRRDPASRYDKVQNRKGG
jgi:hypothetical protein